MAALSRCIHPSIHPPDLAFASASALIVAHGEGFVSLMRTRRGFSYRMPQSERQWRAVEEEERSRKRRRRLPAGGGADSGGQKMATEGVAEDVPDLFDGLPDDLVVSILSKVSASAASPSDLISFMIT